MVIKIEDEEAVRQSDHKACTAVSCGLKSLGSIPSIAKRENPPSLSVGLEANHLTSLCLFFI